MRFEQRLRILTFCATLPAVLTALALLFIADLTSEARFALGVTMLAGTFFLLRVLHHRLTFPLRTLANVVGAIREYDYSLRGRGAANGDALGELVEEINRLADALRERNLDALESSAFVRAVLAQLDAAVFLFDADGRLQQMNRAGESLLGAGSSAVGKSAEELGLAFGDDLPSSIEHAFPGANGRWSIRRSTFREKGKLHSLLAISDLSRALRDEELLAWQRLVRVLSHELNNSLASIHSTAGTLQHVLGTSAPDDVTRGLAIIANRAESLTRFTQSYARLARLPQPELAPLHVATIVEHVASLRFALPVHVVGGPHAIVLADADQLEQALINLVQNAVDASLENAAERRTPSPASSPRVTITWSLSAQSVDLIVLDDGPGLSTTKNLFVPFFTTKPTGTGIGLVLSRQIAEAHGGSLTLANRDEGGCEARLRVAVATRGEVRVGG